MTLEMLEKRAVTRKWINWYREKHKSRAREVRLKGGLVKLRHPHLNVSYCNICDRDLEEGEEIFLLYVGGHAVGYHVECILENLNTRKVKNVISQDKNYRKKHIFEVLDTFDDGLGLRGQFYKYLIKLISLPQ
jgi:hypothetical protein